MRIIIACHPTFGGSGVVASELAMALSRRGNEIHVLSYSTPLRIRDRSVLIHQVEVTDYPLFRYPPYALALATRMAEVARKHAIDVIHVHYAIPHAVSAYLAGEILGGPRSPRIVTTLHGTDITLVGRDPSYWGVTRFAIERSDGVTAVSRWLARETLSQFSLKREVRFIPNFVDTDHFSPARRREEVRSRFASDDEFVITHLSNFRPVKRIEDLIRVFHLVQARVPCRLVLIGSGPDLELARALSRDLGIPDRVAFLGAIDIDEVADVLAASDLFILPSSMESFGLAILEAMSSAVPVISTRSGGIGEVVVDGETGFLLDVGDVRGMADRALEILGDPSIRRRLSARSRRVAVEVFPIDGIVGAYEAYYREILGRTG